MKAKKIKTGSDTGDRKLKLSVQYASKQRLARLPTRQQFRRWVKRALLPQTAQDETQVETHVQITLRLVDEAEGRQLNRDFRGKDSATNVLTFTYTEGASSNMNAALMGDIVLCAPVIAREAETQQKNVLAHYAHLVVHGVLHLQGHDHQQADQAEKMESLETQLLKQLGIANPY
jgi:probable rRNA maturation factor